MITLFIFFVKKTQTNVYFFLKKLYNKYTDKSMDKNWKLFPVNKKGRKESWYGV